MTLDEARAMCALDSFLSLAVYRGHRPLPFDRDEAIAAIDKARKMYEPILPCPLCHDDPERMKRCPSTRHAAPRDAHAGTPTYGCGKYGPVIGLRCNEHRDGKHRSMVYETVKTDRAAEEWPLDEAAAHAGTDEGRRAGGEPSATTAREAAPC